MKILDVTKTQSAIVSSVVLKNAGIVSSLEEIAKDTMYSPTVFFDRNVDEITCKSGSCLYSIKKWTANKNKVTKIGSFYHDTILDTNDTFTKLFFQGSEGIVLLPKASSLSIKITGKEKWFDIIKNFPYTKAITKKGIRLGGKSSGVYMYLREEKFFEGNKKVNGYKIYVNIRKKLIDETGLSAIQDQKGLLEWIAKYMSKDSK